MDLTKKFEKFPEMASSWKQLAESFYLEGEAILPKAMESLLRSTQKYMKPIIKKQYLKRARRLLPILQSSILHIHMRQKELKNKSEEKHSKLLFLMLLALLIDLYILLNSNDNKQLHLAIQALHIYTDTNPMCMVIALLYCNLIKKEYSRVCQPMLRHVFSLVSDRPLQPKDYLRCLFLLRLWNKCTTYKAEVTQWISKLKCSESQASNLRVHLREIVTSFMSSETMMSVYDPEWICNFFLYQKFPPGFPKELRKLLCEKDVTTSSERHLSSSAGNDVSAHDDVATNGIEESIVFKTLVPGEDMDQVSSEMEEVPGNENISTNDLFFIDKEGDQNIILDQLAQETEILLLGGGQRRKIDEEKLCATKKQDLAGPVSLQKECNLILGGDDSHKIEKRLKKKLAKHKRKDEISEQNNEAKSNQSQSLSIKGTTENEEKKKRKHVPCNDDDENSVKHAKVLAVSHTTVASKTQAMRLCSAPSEKELKKNVDGTETLESTSNVILETAVDAKTKGKAKKRKKKPSKDTAMESHLASSEKKPKKNADGTDTQQSIEKITLEASIDTKAKSKARKKKKKTSKTSTVRNDDGISKTCIEVPLTSIVKEEMLSSTDDINSPAKKKIYEEEMAPSTKDNPVGVKFVKGSDKTPMTDKTPDINKKKKRKNAKSASIIVKICRPDIVSNTVSDEKGSGAIRENSTSTNEKLLPENTEDYAKENLTAPQYPNISTISSDTKVKNVPQKQSPIKEALHTVASNIKEKCKETKQKTKSESSGISDCGSKEKNCSLPTKVTSSEIRSNSNPLKEKGVECSFSDDEEDTSLERKLDEITASFNSNKDLDELTSRETSDKEAEETSILCNSNDYIQVPPSTDGISTTETSSCPTIKRSSDQNAKNCLSEDPNVCNDSKSSASKLLPNLNVGKSSDEDIENECESKKADIDSASLCLCSGDKLDSSKSQQQQNDVTGDPEADPLNSSPKFNIGESFSQSAPLENCSSKAIDDEETYISQKASSANSLDESKEVAAALQINSDHLSQEVEKQLGESIVLDTSEEEEEETSSAKSNRAGAKDGTEEIMEESIEICETQPLVDPLASVDINQSIDKIQESAEEMEHEAIITNSSNVVIPTQTDCEQEVSSLHTQKDVPHKSNTRMDEGPLNNTIASSQTMQVESIETRKSLETEETVHLLESKSQATSVCSPSGIGQSKPIVTTPTMKISSPSAEADSSVITRIPVVKLQDCLKGNYNFGENSENSKNLGGVQKPSPQKSSDLLIQSEDLSSDPTAEKPSCISFKPNELLSPVRLKRSNRTKDETKVWKSNGLDFANVGNIVSEASKCSEITTNFISATSENPQRLCSLENIEEDDEDVFHTPETSDSESDAHENSPNLTEKSSAIESKDNEKESVIPPKSIHSDDCSIVGYSLKHMRLHSPASKSQDVLPSEECSCKKKSVAPRRSVRIRKLSSASEHSENEDEAKPKSRRKITVASRLRNIPEASPQPVKPDMSKKETVTSEDQVLPFDKALPGSAGYNLRVRKPLIAPSKLK